MQTIEESEDDENGENETTKSTKPVVPPVQVGRTPLPPLLLGPLTTRSSLREDRARSYRQLSREYVKLPEPESRASEKN